MHNIVPIINAISLILSLPGIVSIRMFTPVFIYMLFIRYGGHIEFLASAVERMQSMTPHWMNNDLIFIIVGILASLEIIANWNSALREFLNDSQFEKNARVILSALITFGFLSQQEVDGLQEIQTISEVKEATILPLAMLGAIVSGALTAFFVKLRSSVVRCVHLIDPGNDLHLQTMLVGAEESLALFILVLAIALPILSLLLALLVLGLGKILQTSLKKIEESTNHLCSACGKSISSLAEICPECGARQEEVATIGLCGLPRRASIDLNDVEQLHAHRLKLLILHRCPHCATPLRYTSCRRCHTRIWQDNAMRIELVQYLDRRAIVIALVGLLVNGIPIIGFVTFYIAFNALVMSPLRAFLNPLRACIGKLLFTSLKILFVLLIALLSAVIPFAGLLVYIPYVFYYLHNRKAFLNATAFTDA